TQAETGRWGASNPICLLNCHPTCVNDYDVHPVRSIKDLKTRFHFALLSGNAGASAQRWRRENVIDITRQRILTFPHFAPFAGAMLQGKIICEAGIREALETLLASTGTLTTQLNSCHAGAVEIYGVG